MAKLMRWPYNPRLSRKAGKQSDVRKLSSRCRAYEQDPCLPFYIYDCVFAKSFLSKQSVAENNSINGDIAADSLTVSESYWRHEQDHTAGIVR